MEEIDRAIMRHAETELLYGRPYEDRRVVRASYSVCCRAPPGWGVTQPNFAAAPFRAVTTGSSSPLRKRTIPPPAVDT